MKYLHHSTFNTLMTRLYEKRLESQLSLLLKDFLTLFLTIMRMLTIHCQWEDETERTGRPPSYAKAKKMKLPTLHTHSSLRSSLKDCSCSFVIYKATALLRKGI